MGNVTAGGLNDAEEEDNELFEDGQDSSLSGDKSEGALDVGVLFDHALLREAASKIKEEPNDSILQQHSSAITRWLEERLSRHEEFVSLSQFTDMLVGKGANKEDCVELFNQFDAEGEGYAHVESFLETLQAFGGGINLKGDLRTASKALQNCCLTPGFVDAFADNKEAVLNHGRKLLKFLLRNRASSTSLPLPALEGFCNTSEMRLKVLQAHMDALKEKADIKKKAPSVEEGEVLRPLMKCYTAIEVSSNKGDISRLTNGDPSSYWQSDGPARSHWIRLRMRPNVVLKQLSINVGSSDQSYMPHQVVVSAGRDEQNLRDISDVRIPVHVNGDFVLVENIKIPYPIIQINIRRCHSDGCDTRIRGIKAVGYRVLRNKGMSVGDASAVWFLSVLGATATAAMPMAPHLKDVILANTRSALTHIKALCLSATSPDRPAFLSQNVLEEIENFLQSIVRYGESIQPESLKILLEFTLARGNLKSIFKVLKLLYEIADQDFVAADIIRSLSEVQLRTTKYHGGHVKMSLTSCDGGHKDNSTKPENVLSENWSSEAYLSESGKRIVTMMFSSASSVSIKLTRLIIKVSKGDIGPSHGMVFVLDDLKRDEKEKEKEGLAQEADPLSKYNSWIKATYSDFLASSKDKSVSSHDGPVAFFTTEEDWDEAEVHVDTILTGKYVVVKFLGARKESAERIGVLGINFFGYEIKPNCPLTEDLQINDIAPLPSGNTVEGSVLFLRVLSFLDEMAKDQAIVKSRPKTPLVLREKEGHLEMGTSSLQMIWDVYSLVTSRGVKHRKIVVGCVLLLRLLYQSLPYLKSQIRDLTIESKEKKAFEEQQELAAKVFAHLCDVVDDDKQLYDERIHLISKKIILEGAELFFPDSQTRRNHLLSMVDHVMEEKKAVSLALTFESLCRFFSNKDASGLLGLPDSVTQEGFNFSPVIAVMTTLLSVAFQECQNCLMNDSASQSHTTSNLVQLLCAMQRSLLTWCSGQIKSENPFGFNVATSLITDYVGILANKVQMSLQAVHGMRGQLAVIDRLEHSYVSASTRQLVLFLNLFTNVDTLCMPILRSLQPVSLELKKFSHDFPELFFKIDSEEWNKAQGQTVLRKWDVESPHNYENNQDVNMVFSCPGCSEFTVDFDPRCETERRYDFLEFTDSSGNKKRFDQRVGTEKWPKSVTFKAGNRLLFNFHSDGSNNEWGYKFTVTAKGSPDVALSWIFDLQLGMARLFGQLCSSALDSRKASPKLPNVNSEEEETKLLHSEIWTTLFRGGYMTGKLQRSLSGYHETTSSPAENSVNVFLHMIITGGGGTAGHLIESCHEKTKGPFIGGPLVDKAISSVFAALIWHSQELRDQIVLYSNNTPPETVPEGIQEAYLAAESLRRSLVDRRQRLIIQAEEESSLDTSPSKKTNPDAPVIACMDKAQFLLKFAGLQRITEKIEGRENRRSKWLGRNSSWQRSSLEHSGSYLSGPKQRSFSVEEIRSLDKHPAFKLILDFVLNDSYSHERIESLLQQRVKHANTVADIYLFAADFLRVSSGNDLVQAPAVLFLQQFLASQKRFPSHYANNLDGCGLSLENKVRRAYYALVRRCLDGIRSYHSAGTHRPSSTAFECLRAFVLHLLDTEWKPYDHTFLLDVHLPEFLLDTTKATVVQHKAEANDLNEQQELDHYEEGTKWFKDAKTDFDAWFSRMRDELLTHQQRRRMHLFVARFSDLLSVTITCNGCDETLSGRRYRCLDCLDVDLCNTCYMGGIKPEGHLDSHNVIDMRYKCDECQSFIVGTRFHCNECDDFDLCIGCHSFGKFPARHSSTHKVTKFPPKTDSASDGSTNNSTSLVQNYTHQHAWLQFSALVLTLANTVNEPTKTGLNPDYLRTAGLLHMECFDQITKSLTHAVHKLKEGSAEEDKGSTKADPKTKEGAALTGGNVAALEATATGERAASSEAGGTSQSTPVMTPTTADKGTLEAVGPTTISGGTSTDASHTAVAGEAALGPGTDSLSQEGDAGTSRGESGQAEALGAAQCSEETAAVAGEVEGRDTETATSGVRSVSVGTDQDVQEVKVPETAPLESEKDVPSAENNAEQGSTKEAAGQQSIEDVEKTFATGAQEKLLGLLGAILPEDSKLSHWTRCCLGMEEFISQTFLPALFKIIRDGNNDDKLKTLALGVLGKFLQCTSPDVSDRGITPYCTSLVKTESECSSEERSSGKATVEFLFQLGAEYLARSDLNASSGMATTLQQMASSHQWQPSVADHVGLCLERLAQPTENVDLSAVFGLLVFARFPDVMRMGSVTQMKDLSGENRNVVVLKHYPDKAAVTVLDIKSRKRKTVKEHRLDESPALNEAFKTSRFSVLLEIVVTILRMLKEKKTVPVERMWVLYLALKGLLGSLKSTSSFGLNTDMVSSGIVPLLVSIACRGTSFSSQWLLRDLEVLSLKLYKSEKSQSSSPMENKASEGEGKSATKPVDERGAGAAAPPVSVEEDASDRTEVGGRDPLDGLDDITRTCFETIREAMNVPSAVLRAIFENVGQDQSRLLVEVQQGFDGNTFQVSDKVKEEAKKWEQVQKKDGSTRTDSALDIGVVRYTAKEILLQSVQAKPEESDVAQKLIPTLSDAEIAETRDKQARTKSAELLKKELQSEPKPESSEYLTKVNLALSIIYSRHLLALLLGEWPECHVITAGLMDNSDEVQFIGLLDILQRLESNAIFEKVVSSVVRYGDPKLVHPLSLAAAHCMGEAALSTETRESSHNYSNDTKEEGKVHIAGAAMLFVKFDPRCATEDGCDELVISSSPDYEQNRHVFSGPHGRWIDVEIPGDTLYYLFTSDGSNNDWGWKFVVTGGQLGRFKTGFTVLNALLSLDYRVARSLPLKKLWVWLVSVACCQTGQQRLMATGLLLRLLLVVSGYAVDSAGNGCQAVDECERPDLSLLKPLWALYTSMLEKETGPGAGPTLVSPVLRGLTELFLVVENLAQGLDDRVTCFYPQENKDWGMAEDLVVGFTTTESLKRCFSQAVQKVGLIGLAIGLPNKASQALIQAASNPPPAQDTGKKDGSKPTKVASFSMYEVPFTLSFGADENEDDTTSDSSSSDDSEVESE